jgi:hypothetical protein
MDISPAEFAVRRGISERRVLQLIEQGLVRARRSGGRWFIDAQELNKRANLCRPMNPRMARALMLMISDDSEQVDLNPVQMHRLKKHLAELHSHKYPAWLLSSWLRKRGEVISLSAKPVDLQKLKSDSRIYLSGLCDPRSGISVSDFAEGYVDKKKLRKLKEDYLLVDSNSPNVILRVIDIKLERPMPIGFVLADLSDHNGPREDAQVARLLRSL